MKLILCDTFADEYFDCKMKCFLNGLKIAFILHRIHKTLLDLVEDHYAEGEENAHEDEAVDKPAPSDEFTGSEETVLEGLDDGSNRVEAH